MSRQLGHFLHLYLGFLICDGSVMNSPCSTRVVRVGGRPGLGLRKDAIRGGYCHHFYLVEALP